MPVLYFIIISIAIVRSAMAYLLVLLWKSSIYSKKEKWIYTFIIVFLSFVGCVVFYLMNSERKKLSEY